MNSSQRQLLGVVLFTAVVVLLNVNLTWQDGDEDRYVVLGRAIASGQGVTAVYLPDPRPEWATPPGYPWVLAVMMRMAGMDRLVPLMALSALFYVAFSAVLVRIFQRELENSRELVLPTVLMALLPVFALSFVWRIFSEALSLLVFFAAFLCCLAAVKSPRSLRWALAGGLLAGAGLAIRPTAVVLLPAGFLHFAARRRWREALLFSLSMLVASVPALWETHRLVGSLLPSLMKYGQEGPGGGPLQAVVAAANTIAWGLPHYLFVELPRRMFFALFHYHCLLCKLHLGVLVTPLSVSVAILVLIGFFSRLRSATVLEFFWLFYWPLFCSFNSADFAQRGQFNYQERYLIPVLSLAALYFAVGLVTLAHLLPRRYPAARTWTPRVIVGLAALYVTLAALGAGAVRTRNELRVWGLHPWDPRRYEVLGTEDEQPWAQYVRTGFWIRDHLPTNVIVVSRKPQHTFLFSGRRGCRYDGTDVAGSSSWEIITAQLKFGPVAILQDAFPAESGYGRDRIAMLDPLIEAHRKDLKLIYESPPPVTRLWLLTGE